MEFKHLALAFLVIIIWGFNFVVIKVGLQEIPPLLLCATRFFLTSIPAIFFIQFPNVPFKKVALYGLIMFALQFGLLFLGMYAGVTPGLASLLLQCHVFFTIFLSIVFLHEKLHPWQFFGALISFSGIALIGINIGGNVTALGFILLITAAASWSMGNLISKKMGKVNITGLVIWGSLIAWPPLLTASFILEGPERIFLCIQNLSWLPLAAALYITYLSTVLGFVIWNWLLHQYPLQTMAPFTLLVPIVAMVSSWLVLGEALESWKIFATILVVTGLSINVLGPKISTKGR